ncbi:MAG: DUF4440 domain-containing protein [Anaeromyxobacteraceae bacterium]
MITPLRLTLALSLVLAFPALAEDKPAAGGADPMAGWKPPVVKNEKKDRQEIEAMLKKMETASQKADLEGAAALVDFPVLMVTDDSKGEGGGDVWSREQWTKVMKPFYAQPSPPDAMKPGKRTIVLISDSLAIVGSGWTMKMGPKAVSGTSGLVLVRKGGEWKAKGMIEGGWGDMPMDGAPDQPAAK